MGPTGVGKSTVGTPSLTIFLFPIARQFINRATRQDSGTIGHKLKSCTTEIQAVQTYHPKTKHPIVFVDTPGFDDTFKSDTEILALIEAWLVQVFVGFR